MKPNKWKLALNIIISLAIISFLVQRLIKSYSQISDYPVSINYAFLFIAVILGIVGFTMFGISWIGAVSICGNKLELKQGMLSWFRSQMIKYLPGTIWMFISRVYDCQKCGIEKKTAILSIYMECILLGLSALILSIALNYRIIGQYVPVAVLIPIFMASLLLIHPAVLNKILSIFKKKGIQIKTYSYRRLLGLLIFYIISWAPLGMGFALLVNSITPIPFSDYPYVAGAFILSWVLGFISIFSPGGIGVREGAIAIILAQILPEPIAIIAAFGSRIWWIIIEVSSFIFWYLFNKLSVSKPEPETRQV
ncbi:MAG TPA: hypothetical protein HA362_00695 [Nanoarchaeota archaeon]|nr:hypothetical protein [Nanoarchaeota archaeon]